MSDTQQSSNDSGRMGPVIGFALGAVVGGVLALMLAPDSGEKTRRRIGAAARRLGRDTRHTLEGMGEAASGLGGDVRAAISAGRDAFQHDGGASEEGTLTRPTPRTTAPPRPL